MPLSELPYRRICKARLDGTCPGRDRHHCEVHDYQGGCSAGFCDGTRVGPCTIWCGEEIAREEIPELNRRTQ